jgi:hypothetical protein
MACQAPTNQALTYLASDGSTSNAGHKYTVLGWIDAAHLMVEIDPTTLAVLNANAGTVTNLALPNADQVQMGGVVAGAA